MKFNMNLVPIGGPGKPIEMGGMMHKILEKYYLAKRDGKHRDDAAAEGIKEGQLVITGCEACVVDKCTTHKDAYKGLENTDIDGAYLVLDTFKQYHDFYKNDSWVTIGVETTKGEVIYEDDNISLMWKAKIDWEIDNLEGIFSVDHKTMSRRGETLSLDNQFTGQSILMKQNKVFINKIGFQTSLKPEEKFERIALNYSDRRKIEWINETASYAYDMIDAHKNARYRHRYTSCKRAYGPCMFRRVCEGEPADRSRLLAKEFKVGKAWDINNEE